jgi:hypothetical protein
VAAGCVGAYNATAYLPNLNFSCDKFGVNFAAQYVTLWQLCNNGKYDEFVYNNKCGIGANLWPVDGTTGCITSGSSTATVSATTLTTTVPAVSFSSLSLQQASKICNVIFD